MSQAHIFCTALQSQEVVLAQIGREGQWVEESSFCQKTSLIQRGSTDPTMGSGQMERNSMKAGKKMRVQGEKEAFEKLSCIIPTEEHQQGILEEGECI